MRIRDMYELAIDFFRAFVYPLVKVLERKCFLCQHYSLNLRLFLWSSMKLFRKISEQKYLKDRFIIWPAPHRSISRYFWN